MAWYGMVWVAGVAGAAGIAGSIHINSIVFCRFLFAYFLFAYFHIFIFASLILSYLHIFKNAAHMNSMHRVSKMFHRTEGIASESGIC
jgi:hypothetical protein